MNAKGGNSHAPGREDELERVRELLKYKILDTPDEKEFDDLTRVAAYLCDAGCAQINFLDQDRLWTKSCHGWDLREIPRLESMCNHTIQQDKYLIVNDISKDPRFKDHGSARSHEIHFYAGVALKSSHGYNIGTLCVFDTAPRELTGRQLEALQVLGSAVEAQLELRLIREQLLEEHKKFRKSSIFLRNSTDILLVLDPDSLKVLEVSEGVKKLLGYSVEEVLGTALPRYVQQKGFSDQFERWVKNPRDAKYSAEIEMAAKNGERYWLLFTGSKESGRVYATARNITRRKRAEQRFLKQLKFTDDIIHHMPGIFFLVNREGRLKKWNHNLEEVTSLAPDDLKNKTYLEFIAGEDHAAAGRAFQKIFDEGFARTEVKAVTRDGDEIPLLLAGFSYRTNGEHYATGIGINITEEKMALEELGRKEKKLKEAQRIGKMGSWTWHIPTNRIFWSDEVYGLYDLDNETFRPSIRNFMKMLPESEQKKVRDIIKRILDGEEWKEVEIQVMKPDGSIIYIRERGEVLRDNDGHPVEVSGTMQDVTAERENEEKIKAALKEKDILLSEIHHRVKNNLAIVSGLFQLEMLNTDNEQLKFILAASQTRIKSMALIHESLYSTSDFADISFGNYLRELISSIMDTFINESENIEVEMDTMDLSLSINQAIPCALLVNELIINVLKHAFPDSAPGRIRLTLHEKNGFVHLSVADNGVGMDPGVDLENPGSLGLTLVKALTRQLHGELNVDVNGGTDFQIKFKAGEGKSQ